MIKNFSDNYTDNILLSGFLWWKSQEEKIALQVRKTGQIPDTVDIESVVKTILPIYKDLVESGMPPYDTSVPQSIETLRAVVAETGIEYKTVLYVLDTIMRMAKTGQIDYTLWNPEKTRTIKGPPISESIAKAIESVLPDIPEKTINKQINKILLTSAIILLIYLLGKFTIKEFLTKG